MGRTERTRIVNPRDAAPYEKRAEVTGESRPGDRPHAPPSDESRPENHSHELFNRSELETLKAQKPLFWKHARRICQVLEAQGTRHYDAHCPTKESVETGLVIVCQEVTNETTRSVDKYGDSYELWLSAFSTHTIQAVKRHPTYVYSCLNPIRLNPEKDNRLEYSRSGRDTIDGHKEMARLIAGEVVNVEYPGHINGYTAYRYFAVPAAVFIEATRA